MNKKPPKATPLIINHEGQWVGLFADELPGIITWVLSCDRKETYSVLKDVSQIPTLQQPLDEAEESMNPLLAWIQENIQFARIATGKVGWFERS